MTKQVSRIFPCPTCGQASVLAANNPWRPFCSERCQQIDLGSWAGEEHRIAGEPLLDALDSSGLELTKNDEFLQLLAHREQIHESGL